MKPALFVRPTGPELKRAAILSLFTTLVCLAWPVAALAQQAAQGGSAINIDLGSGWLQRFYHELCEQNPQVPCFDEEHPDRVWTSEDIWRFINVLKEQVTGGIAMVSEEEQLRRIAICKDCPKIGDIACRYCGVLAETLSSFIAGRKLPRVDEVYKRSCLACGCDITSKTAYPVAVLRAVDAKVGSNPEYVPGCWMHDSA